MKMTKNKTDTSADSVFFLTFDYNFIHYNTNYGNKWVMVHTLEKKSSNSDSFTFVFLFHCMQSMVPFSLFIFFYLFIPFICNVSSSGDDIAIAIAIYYVCVSNIRLIQMDKNGWE